MNVQFDFADLHVVVFGGTTGINPGIAQAGAPWTQHDAGLLKDPEATAAARKFGWTTRATRACGTRAGRCGSSTARRT